MQKIAVLLFVAAAVAVPLAAKDVFPSTSAARFRDPLQSCYQFSVFDPTGKALEPEWFGLHRNYAGIPVGEGTGRNPPESLNPLGTRDAKRQVPTAAEVQEWVASRFASAWERRGEQGPTWSYVRVVATVYQPVGRSVGADSWQVVVFKPAGEL
ncbi:MAG: hypothetical protein Q8M16_14535 [Pirellulaceae bacterium]|nr:hypothetical protein [Pirellulaceae bacterium]